MRRDWRQQDLGEPVGARTWSGPNSAGAETKHIQRRPLPGLPKLAVAGGQSPLLAALIAEVVRSVGSRSAIQQVGHERFRRRPHHAAFSVNHGLARNRQEASWEVLIPAGIPVRRPRLRPCSNRSAS